MRKQSITYVSMHRLFSINEVEYSIGKVIKKFRNMKKHILEMYINDKVIICIY